MLIFFLPVILWIMSKKSKYVCIIYAWIVRCCIVNRCIVYLELLQYLTLQRDLTNFLSQLCFAVTSFLCLLIISIYMIWFTFLLIVLNGELKLIMVLNLTLSRVPQSVIGISAVFLMTVIPKYLLLQYIICPSETYLHSKASIKTILIFRHICL